MKQRAAEGDGGSTGCAWGCLGALGLGLVLLILGWDLFGRLCIFLVFALALLQALRDRGFHLPFRDGRLTREANPLAFWGLAALDGAFALFALWTLIDEVRQGTG